MNTDAIKKIKDFKTLAHFLVEELNWPIDPENVDVDELTFEYSPEEIGLSEDFATKVKNIKQIRPFNSNQPWSIFWIDFENKKLPLTVLRRILNVFVTKKRGNSRNLATTALEDIMFVSGHGENANRAITFAHFKRLDDVETIREFYWDGYETKFEHISNYLEKLTWPTNTNDILAWRNQWKGAFTGSTREAISTSDQLAKAMANIAKNIRDRVLEVLAVESKNGPVHKLFDTFRTSLVHDMTEKGFADMYAQTITYGLFSARTMDTDGHFELHEVIDLIPSTNPFLKNLFKECLKTGNNNHKIDLDELGVGKLVELFDNLNRSDGTDSMQRILSEFGRQTLSGQEDPVIHFYEGFLKEYDNIQRVDKGVYYTPDPVVSFIVKSVNNKLKTDFGLEMGLADTTTWGEMVASGRADYPSDPSTGKINKAWIDKIKGRAFVQILDPATGTGTFLKHVIEIIHEEVRNKYNEVNIVESWNEYWNNYVYYHLLPRIYGFELMMASYSVAHMKIGLFLKSLGYNFDTERRLNIYLTNTLEPYSKNNSANLFFTSVSKESSQANDIKLHRLFTVVLGNPPYNALSKNNDKWILKLIDDYKYINGVHFNEKKHWLNDDYVKFIRLGQKLIENNGIGILTYINPHGYLDNSTFRGMRWNLSNCFKHIYTLDLHGNSNKKEKCPDGSTDFNVFDIQQGVSINLFLKPKKNTNHINTNISHAEIFGTRVDKYNFLINNNFATLDFKNIIPEKPNYFFVHKDNTWLGDYNSGFSINDLFKKNSVGFVTANDRLNISFTDNDHRMKISDILTLDESEWRIKYKRKNDSDSWKYIQAKKDASVNFANPLSYIAYRPFDIRVTLYTGKSGGLYARPAFKIMQHFNNKKNVGLIVKRQCKQNFTYVFVTNKITESCLFESAYANNSVFPLYLYSENNEIFIDKISQKNNNLDEQIISKVSKLLGLTFVDNDTENSDTFNPIQFFDYIYAILHSPSYREKYQDYLKMDFPRVPFPKEKEMFWKLIKVGCDLRQIHLLESNILDRSLVEFSIKGDNLVKIKPYYDNGKVWINKTQYFENIPSEAWEFFIGGYQPAQKWLQERKGIELNSEDINHYKKIILALFETNKIIFEIDNIISFSDEIEPIFSYSTNEEESYDDFNIAAEPGN